MICLEIKDLKGHPLNVSVPIGSSVNDLIDAIIELSNEGSPFDLLYKGRKLKKHQKLAEVLTDSDAELFMVSAIIKGGCGC